MRTAYFDCWISIHNRWLQALLRTTSRRDRTPVPTRWRLHLQYAVDVRQNDVTVSHPIYTQCTPSPHLIHKIRLYTVHYKRNNLRLCWAVSRYHLVAGKCTALQGILMCFAYPMTSLIMRLRLLSLRFIGAVKVRCSENRVDAIKWTPQPLQRNRATQCIFSHTEYVTGDRAISIIRAQSLHRCFILLLNSKIRTDESLTFRRSYSVVTNSSWFRPISIWLYWLPTNLSIW